MELGDSLKMFLIIGDDPEFVHYCCGRDQDVCVANQFPSFPQICVYFSGF